MKGTAKTNDPGCYACGYCDSEMSLYMAGPTARHVISHHLNRWLLSQLLLLVKHGPLQSCMTSCEVASTRPTGARAKTWCLLRHAEASFSLSGLASMMHWALDDGWNDGLAVLRGAVPAPRHLHGHARQHHARHRWQGWTTGTLTGCS